LVVEDVVALEAAVDQVVAVMAVQAAALAATRARETRFHGKFPFIRSTP
jgi:hypothetical protein